MRHHEIRMPLRLSQLLAALMALQSVLGLIFPGEYRDAEWIRATWFGNDWVTLLLAFPLLCIGLARRGAVRPLLLWFGMLGYALYNYAFYLLGAALNRFFPLYIAALLLAGFALILALYHVDVEAIARSFRRSTPARIIGGYLVFLALGLSTVWMVVWAAYAFAGRLTPTDTEVFKLVAALDMTLMVPALAVGGVLLWMRRPWGYLVASIAGIQGALYLLVLAVNSVVAIQRGHVEPPGELPMWGALALATAIATVALLSFAATHDLPPTRRP